MAGRVGTHDIASLLAANFQSVAQFGYDTVALVLEADIAVHNRIVTEELSSFVEITSDRQRITGASTAGVMLEVDEYSRGPTQKEQLGSTVAFPLKKFQYPVGWTNQWLKMKTPKDMAIMTLNAQKAHLRKIETEIKKAIYLSGNYAFRDALTDNISFTIRRFLNADGSQVGDGPNGEIFDGTTHTHYLANATLTPTVMTSLVQTVIEHGFGGTVRVAISRTDEATVRALSGFQPYLDPRISIGTYANQADRVRLDITRLDNRPIGIFDAAEIWTKPWGIANYAFAYDDASPQKPLAMRQGEAESLQGLRIAAELDAYPLHAQYMEAEFGFGAWTRANGAVLYFGGGSYVDPTISG